MIRMNALFIKLAVFLITALFIGAMIYITSQSKESVLLQNQSSVPIATHDISNPKDEPDPTQQNIEVIIVEVKGEVIRPGVYEVVPHSRVYDVIQLAGGLTDQASSLSVNMAERVYDEMSILVPKEGEENLAINGDPANELIKLNIATLEQIQLLPGIGPAKAEAIIQYREEHGPFKDVEDLLNVDGIGEKTLEKLKEHIRIP